MAIKRIADIIISTVLLILLIPVFIIVALLVRIKFGPPVLFIQERVGLNERPFRIYKFRTMTSEMDAQGALLSDDERLTPFGKFLRSTSMDELPELLNVIRGHMSLVGPRPLFGYYLPFYKEEEKKRFTMRPGITGWAQVNGRNDVSWDERLKLDIWYVDHWSLTLDLKILFMTALRVLARKGVEASPGSVMLALDEERGELSSKLLYTELTHEYCKDIVELHHRAFDHRYIAPTIFASPRVHSYLASLIAFPGLQHGHALFGGFYDNKLVSYAHFRSLDDSFHLNNIAISPRFQGRGIGSKMIEIFRALAIENKYSKLSLRVSSDNEMACNWYERLGFEQKNKIYLYEQELNIFEDNFFDGFELNGWENAEAWHNSYGFSSFEVKNGDGCWKIMRIGDAYFRVNGCIPTSLLSVLKILDPQRKLISISDSPLDIPRAKLLQIYYWMEADIGTF